MKGFLPTSALLKTVLDKQYGLRGNSCLSHCAVLGIKGYARMFNVTDGGMLVNPTFEQKLQVAENAITVARALGLALIRIAVAGMSPLEVTKKAKCEKLINAIRAKYHDVMIEGPMGVAEATRPDSTGHSSVAGMADIYLVDSIEEGNIISKSLIQFAGAVFAGVIVGAKVPISLVSRTDTIGNKKASLAVACLLADYYKRKNIWKKMDDQL